MIDKALMSQLVEGRDLSAEQMRAAMQAIMTGECSDAQIGGFLVALRMKGETVDEIAAAAKVMRDLATPVPVTAEYQKLLVDTCGTGGDASGLFNVSTASAFVVAAAGGRVAKHGNRSVSSKSGSADLLEVAGVKLVLSPDQVGECVAEVGLGFMFAPGFHGAMKHAIGPRKELGIRTIFNILGPLTNPAGAPNQVLGVFNGHLTRPLAEVLQQLGSQHVLVVHGEDGLDEFSINAPTRVAELKDGQISEYQIAPEDVGLERGSLDALRVDNAEESLALINAVFAGEKSLARDMLALNAGAALYAGGQAVDIAEGVQQALLAIDTGEAAKRLSALVEFTQGMPDE
ncbi:MAG: anthranilate phosphoribosyltransferase [Salinisphaeraceae bacterium]|nr:anthranilate phosphoribosyltransferase [Salinisphaeraceae bacterium]